MGLVMCTQFMACTTGDLNVGLPLGTGQSQSVSLIDTMALSAFTLKTDSLISSNTGYITVGSIIQSETNTLTTSGVFNLTMPINGYSSYGITETLKYDSSKMVFPYDSYIGDTTVNQRFSMFQLEQDLDKNATYYASSKVAVSSIEIANFDYRVRPSKDTSYSADVDSTMAKGILQIYTSGADNSQNLLQRFVKGFCLKSIDAKGIITRFPADKSYMRIYAHGIKTGTSYYFDFPVDLNNTQFNVNTFSSSLGALNSLKTYGQEVASEQTEHLVSINGAMAMGAKIVIHGIDKLQEVTTAQGIYKVELIMYAKNKSIKGANIPPATLGLYRINLQNQYVDAIYDASNSAVTAAYAYDPGALVYQGQYVFDITNYYKSVLNNVYESKGIMILPGTDELNSYSFSGVQLGDQQHPDFPCKLLVYYSTVK